MEPETKADLAIRMFRRLPPDALAILNLNIGIDGHDYSLAEIARILRTTKEHAKQRIDHAERLLKLAIGDEDLSRGDLYDLVIAGRMREEQDPKPEDDAN